MSRDITQEKAAEILGVDLVLLERWVRAGRLTPWDIDGEKLPDFPQLELTGASDETFL